MNNFLRGFGNFKKNENGINEYVDYLGTKYTYDLTTKKWKSNGRILSEAALDDMVLSEQEGVGDAADDSGGNKKRLASIASAIVGIADYAGMPASITSALDYEVWGAHFSPDMFNESPVQYRFAHPSFTLHSIVPTIIINGNTYNGFREPSDTTANALTTQIINDLKSDFDLIPAGRKVLNSRHWWGVEIGCQTQLHNTYYKNTSDGVTYEGDRVLTCWVENNAEDAADSYGAFLQKCIDAGFTFDYIMNDYESQDVFWIDGRNGFTTGVGPPQSSFSPQFSEARTISAIVDDDSFDLYENSFTQKTLAQEFMENYHLLREKNGFTFDPRTVYEILDPYTGVTGQHNYVNRNTYWQPYGCDGGCEPDGKTIGGLTHPEGYNLFFHVIPAWRAAADSWYFNVYQKKFRDKLNEFPEFEYVISMEYSVDPVSADEVRFFQSSNLELHMQNTVSDVYTGSNRYYGDYNNLIFPSWAGADPGGVNGEELIQTWSNDINQSRSGYVRNPTNDYEYYNFNGYLVDEYKGPAGNNNLIRYPETYPYIDTNNDGIDDERDEDLLTEWYREYCFKYLVYNIKLTRHNLRSDSTQWEKFAPWISYETFIRAKWFQGGYWEEQLKHVLLHGARVIQIFENDYNGYQSSKIHNILDEWRYISGNSRAQPCSNSTGSVDDPVDRVLLYEAFDNILISGGRMVNNPNLYIWRLSVAPKHFVNNVCTLTRQNNDSDLPETITINRAESEEEGVWIRRFTQGVPQYAVAGFNP